MCGIVGVAGSLDPKMERAFRSLLILDSLRGIDSTGVAAISKPDGEAEIAKQVGDPYTLMEGKDFNRIVTPNKRALIGHNRFATQGQINRKNAHPFECKDIVGVHNGTLSNRFNLKGYTQYNVDSEQLYYNIAVDGLEDTIAQCEGAWSLVWWDSSDLSLNFLRNKERPMFFSWLEDKSAMLWASEEWMINVTAYRQDLKITKPVSSEIDVHYSFGIDDKGKLGEPLLATIAGKPPAPPQNNIHRGPWPGKTYCVQPVEKKQTDTTPTPLPAASGNSTKPISPFVEGYIGKENVLVTLHKGDRDINGGTYLLAVDFFNPNLELRLYLRPSDVPARMIGQKFIATVGKYYQFKNNTYYKLEYSSLKREAAQPFGYRDSKGNDMELKEWVNKYGSCCWCTSPIFPQDKYRFTTNGEEAVCDSCSQDPEINPYLKH